jgi:mannose-6-phosphate isomerase-like protein (cupin superfamily)
MFMPAATAKPLVQSAEAVAATHGPVGSTAIIGYTMKQKSLRFGKGFKVVLGNRRSQAAQMVLAPGKSVSNERNRHDGADQWLLVIAGSGTAIINEHRLGLAPGKLLLIERSDRREIRNDGTGQLTTLNFYVPPAYSNSGDELPASEPAEG